MTDEPSDAWKLLDSKISVPAEMRTAQWNVVPQWLKERAFFMAAVSNAEILQVFRDEVAKIANGSSGMNESRRRIGDYLDSTGYKPLPGQEGTIKDLRTLTRIEITLRTNVSLLQGWGQKNRGLLGGALQAFPGWQLIQTQNPKIPRDWPQRFTRAGGKITAGRMVAHKLSPVWKELGNGDSDSLGVDYPPFAFNSGMRWRAVSASEMKKLGLETKAPDNTPEPLRSPSESLQITPRITDKALMDALVEKLGGLVERQGNKLIFTDPNGTRAYTPEQLAAVWAKPLPKEVGVAGGGQPQALIDWAVGKFSPKGQTDRWEDFQRLVLRLKPNGKEKLPLFRALTFNTKAKLSELLEKVQRKGYSPLETHAADSWTSSEAAVRKYLGQERYQVTLLLPNGHSAARDIQPLVKAFEAEILKQEVPQGKLAITDNELLMPIWARFQVKKITQSADGKSAEITLEERP
jgi:hypothetical protein